MFYFLKIRTLFKNHVKIRKSTRKSHFLSLLTTEVLELEKNKDLNIDFFLSYARARYINDINKD